jgi:hypothetical protein
MATVTEPPVVARLVYTILFNPLAKFPGSFLGKCTTIRPMVPMFKMGRVQWQHRMLQEYGSPVRVGISEPYFSDMKSWQDVYD